MRLCAVVCSRVRLFGYTCASLFLARKVWICLGKPLYLQENLKHIKHE